MNFLRRRISLDLNRQDVAVGNDDLQVDDGTTSLKNWRRSKVKPGAYPRVEHLKGTSLS
jgi:hypothetical protein